MNKLDSKAQSAIETYMFYFFALVIVVIVLISLFIYLNPSNLKATTCSEKLGQFNIETDTAINTDKIQLVLTNKTGFDVTNMDFNLSGETTGSLQDQTMQRNQTTVFTIDGTFEGEYEVLIALTYDTVEGLNNNKASAKCSGNL